jgi:ketosteroid isomerase-like protein
MLDANGAAEVGRQFWDTFCANELDKTIDLLADDLVRVGPHDNIESGIIRGKAEYGQFLRDIKRAMPAHGGETYSVGGSPDGRKSFVHCYEIVAINPHSTETYNVQVALVLDLNDQGKITKVDCYWKQPSVNIAWTIADTLQKEAAKA